MLRIGFIGSGNMGEALIRSMLGIRNIDLSIIASDVREERRRVIGSLDRVTATDDNVRVADEAQVIFISVKPQNIDQILEEIRDTEKLIVSIVAGVTIRRIEEKLEKARVIRVMPNTPCLVNEMAGGFALGTKSTDEDQQTLAMLLQKSGRLFQLDEENLNVVTALSGSGPAFLAYIIRSMAEGAISQGLPSNIAENLAVQTALGTGKLLRDTHLSTQALIDMVSSPGGTTVAGMQILENSDIKNVLSRTIAAATRRAKSIGR